MIFPQDYPISNDDYNYSISEGDLINYCITLEKESLPLSMKENLLYFYFPSVNKDIKEGILN